MGEFYTNLVIDAFNRCYGLQDALKKGVDKDKGIIYVKPIWRLIMLLIQLLPRFVFYRSNL